VGGEIIDSKHEIVLLMFARDAAQTLQLKRNELLRTGHGPLSLAHQRGIPNLLFRVQTNNTINNTINQINSLHQ
jgi:hypothetical protein